MALLWNPASWELPQSDRGSLRAAQALLILAVYWAWTLCRTVVSYTQWEWGYCSGFEYRQFSGGNIHSFIPKLKFCGQQILISVSLVAAVKVAAETRKSETRNSLIRSSITLTGVYPCSWQQFLCSVKIQAMCHQHHTFVVPRVTPSLVLCIFLFSLMNFCIPCFWFIQSNTEHICKSTTSLSTYI